MLLQVNIAVKHQQAIKKHKNQHWDDLLSAKRIQQSIYAYNSLCCPLYNRCTYQEPFVRVSRERKKCSFLLCLFVLLICRIYVTSLHFPLGLSGWGIAYYVNDTLIPVLRVRRGVTYMFIVMAGNDVNDGPRYHSFYITDSIEGGILLDSCDDRLVSWRDSKEDYSLA